MKKIFFLLLILVTILNSGCDEDFDVVDNYKEQIIVFLVLDNRSEKQIIKVQKLQNRVGLSSEEKQLSNLTVKLVDTYGNARFFKDTLFENVNNFNVLFLDSMDLKEGSYSLFVNSDDKVYSWANVVVRAKQDIYVSSDMDCYKVTLSKSASSRGYLVRTYLTYFRNEGSSKVEDRVEIPLKFKINGNDTTEIYPVLEKSDISESNNPLTYVRLDAIAYIKAKLKNKYHISEQDFGKICFYAFSYDWNLFEYINSYSGYQDEYSVRLDKPNYSNIIWGNGVFGAIRVDSLELK